ncbi:hypothetical protein M3Y99_01776500 [Aphelenchoides fujianensis]|nr:hypothetical protein M3Y99_01776500 [Aphelenchoides fujianensis]
MTVGFFQRGERSEIALCGKGAWRLARCRFSVDVHCEWHRRSETRSLPPIRAVRLPTDRLPLLVVLSARLLSRNLENAVISELRSYSTLSIKPSRSARPAPIEVSGSSCR